MESRWLRITLMAVLFVSSADRLAQAAFIERSPTDMQADRTALQEDFLKLRFGLFLHFNMATYLDRELANGYEDPSLFRPDKLDCRQWADVACAAGMKYAVFTVKHTGGWCLWDSDHTTHDIASFVNYRGGKGDIVREFVDAFRARGIKVGLYYSCELPWDPKGMLPAGNTMPAEVADKLSLTWFWNTADGPEHARDARKITELLNLCNERNANSLLNIPPDRHGLISGVHLKRMRELAALSNVLKPNR